MALSPSRNSGRPCRSVTFADADRALDEDIDAAYRAKYRRYSANVVGSVVNPEARAATIRLAPGS
ncbi:DUF2255 family protein [Nonomuraea sp. NPDC005650]|uniref:DUF2255 family protein n=1 Tax=Nonomuraea sp. NPDC005650 TaxID=3157045 RepID=UPI0033A934F1